MSVFGFSFFRYFLVLLHSCPKLNYWLSVFERIISLSYRIVHIVSRLISYHLYCPDESVSSSPPFLPTFSTRSRAHLLLCFFLPSPFPAALSLSSISRTSCKPVGHNITYSFNHNCQTADVHRTNQYLGLAILKVKPNKHNTFEPIEPVAN